MIIVFRYQQLIKDNLKEVAKLITTEQGKTVADAEGDVLRGLQVGPMSNRKGCKLRMLSGG